MHLHILKYENTKQSVNYLFAVQHQILAGAALSEVTWRLWGGVVLARLILRSSLWQAARRPRLRQLDKDEHDDVTLAERTRHSRARRRRTAFQCQENGQGAQPLAGFTGALLANCLPVGTVLNWPRCGLALIQLYRARVNRPPRIHSECCAKAITSPPSHPRENRRQVRRRRARFLSGCAGKPG